MSALLFPIHILLIGLAIPLKWVDAPDYETLHSLVTYPLTRLYLFVLISLPLFHWAHRFRYTLYDLFQLKMGTQLIAVACYGRRSYWHIHGGVYAVDGLVDMVCRRPASSAT